MAGKPQETRTIKLTHRRKGNNIKLIRERKENRGSRR